MGIYDWSTTAASNSNADAAINWVENQNSNTVNDSARAMMAAVAAFVEQINGTATSAGSANAYTFTSPSGFAFTSYTAGQMICFKANHENTGAATINVDGLGAKTLKKYGDTDVGSGDIEVDQLVKAIYDGTNFQIVSPIASESAAALDGVTGGADLLPYFTSANVMTTTSLSTQARNLLDDTTFGAMRTTLGLGSAALRDHGVATSSDLPDRADADARYLLESNNLSDLTSASTALTNLGIEDARNITFGTGAAPTLATGEIYFRHDA